MAIITEGQEEEAEQQLPTTSATPADASGIYEALCPLLASRGPRGLLEVVVDFLRRRSDAFKSESAYRELVAVLSAAKEEEDSAASRAAASEKRKMAEKRPREKEESPVKPVPASFSAPAASSCKKESETGEGQEESKASGAEQADSNSKNLRGN